MEAGSALRREMEGLLQQEISPEQFYRSYFEILSKALAGSRGFHLWLLQGHEFVPIGGSPLGPIHYESDPLQQDYILGMLRECAGGQHTLFAGRVERNRCPFHLAFTPLLYGEGGGAVHGAQVSWWEIPQGQDLAPQLAGLLDECGRSAAKMARSQKLESMARISDRLQLMTRFLDEVASAPDMAALAVAIINRAREISGCERCALVVVKPGFRLELKAISNVPFPDPRSAVARTLLQLAEHARSAGLPTAFRKSGQKTEESGDLADYFFHSQMEETGVFGIQAPQQELMGMLILESGKAGFFEGENLKTAAALCTHSAGPLRRALHYERLPALPLIEAIGRWRGLAPEVKRRELRRFVWIPAILVAAILFFPVKYEFSGDVRLMPSQRSLAIAEVPGRVLEVLVSDGEGVHAGQPLARLDDSEQKKQEEIASQEVARFQAETDRLLNENDRTAARVSELNLERARKERDFYAAQVARATVVSPIKGVVMSPGLASRQGEAMAFGSPLAMIGNPGSWEIEILVPEADVAGILALLRDGRTIPVRFILNALPQKRFSTVIERPDAVSPISEVVAGKNVFRITSVLPDNPSDAQLFRAGFTGRAKLLMGRKPLAIAATRRFFNWIRTHVLF